ncbi:zona pellucida sperm-binding protein 3-like [Boleophthalmus pectinirostris]|uniref:zona pellucida sperm-binding protein 3-like n=1 Tax=Boleophthalmus pectinirostris TaxID=150288 RepID=UPI0024327153|nr:zona pellucida sperm-binding protein 3-like [Boleophthalmus pectinirostris]
MRLYLLNRRFTLLLAFLVDVTFPAEVHTAGFVKTLPRTERSSLPPTQLHVPGPEFMDPALPPPYLLLPMSVDSVRPLLDPEHFHPSAGTGLERLPAPVQELLRAASGPRPDPAEPQPEASVRMDCKHNRMYVEVDRGVLASGDRESALRLGSCTPTKATEQYVYFEFKLNKCGTKQTREQDQVVFSNTLHYEPETSPSPIRRTAPFTLHLSCRFNRFQYSYKVGYRPKLSVRNLFRRMRNRNKLTLSPRNALWEPLSSSDTFTLGRPMFFEAQAELPSPGQRLYVHSCFATPDPSPSSAPRFTIVNNYGCMVESKDGRSSFIAHRNDVVRFSVDAFVFHGFEGKQLYMHCSMSLGPDTPTITDKSCNYQPQTRRWVELHGSDDVCSCCESHCGSPASTETVISSRAWNMNVKPAAKKNRHKSSDRSTKRKWNPSVVPTFRPPGERGETGEAQPISEAVRWAVTEERPLEVVGSAEVEELEELEELEEGTHRIFEEIFDLALYNLPESEIKT